MVHSFDSRGTDCRKSSGDKRAHRKERIGAFETQLGRLKHETAAHVKQYETRHNGGITEYRRCGVGLQRNIGEKGKVLRAHQTAANNQARDADQHSSRENVRQQVKEIPRPATSLEEEKTLKHIDQVNEEIEDETVEH